MSKITVYASAQGLYSVTVDQTYRAVICNKDGKGRWYLHETHGRKVTDREPVEVTKILHNTEKLNAEIARFLVA